MIYKINIICKFFSVLVHGYLNVHNFVLYKNKTICSIYCHSPQYIYYYDVEQSHLCI